MFICPYIIKLIRSCQKLVEYNTKLKDTDQDFVKKKSFISWSEVKYKYPMRDIAIKNTFIAS